MSDFINVFLIIIVTFVLIFGCVIFMILFFHNAFKKGIKQSNDARRCPYCMSIADGNADNCRNCGAVL